MKTITITAAEEKMILDALHAAKNKLTMQAKAYVGYSKRGRLSLVNRAINNRVLQHKIINSNSSAPIRVRAR